MWLIAKYESSVPCLKTLFAIERRRYILTSPLVSSLKAKIWLSIRLLLCVVIDSLFRERINV